MQNSKLLRILKTFSAWELRSFDDYVHSPFFNKNEKVCEFWVYIQQYAPDFADRDLSMEAAFRQMFGNIPYDAQAFRYLLTDLTRLCEGFLAYKTWQEDESAKQRHLIQVYQERRLEKYYLAKSRKLHKKLLTEAPRSTHDYIQRFIFLEEQYLSELNRGRSASKYNLQEVMESLDQFYLAKKLRYSSELINRTNVYNESHQIFLISEILTSIQQFPELRTELIELYLKTLLTLIEKEEESHYFSLKEGLEKQLDHLEQAELGHLYAFALNYCIKKLNSGKQAYAREIFDLFKVLVENRIIFIHGQLPTAHYKNIVAIGTRLQEFSWTEQFIDEYRNFLPESEAFNAYTYNQAYLLFAKKAYSEVMRLLSRVEFSDVFYQLDGKTILIKTYYELEEWDALMYLLGSFRIYIRRNKKVSETYRKLYLNLIYLVRMMVRYQLGEKVSLEQIQQQIEARPDVAAGSWIKAKAQEL